MIYKNIMTYYSFGKGEENARYKSWEHCHHFFLENRSDSNMVDFLCLHLAFYLASWGMLRGKSFLLQKDYRVHKPSVEILIEDRYSSLWDCSAESLLEESTIELMLECKQRLIHAYQNKTKLTNGKQSEGSIATDTLITKILLGTLGCSPAYDRYFRFGMKVVGISGDQFNKRNLQTLARFFINNQEFKQAEFEIKRDGLYYPPAKLIDMFFWQVGYDASPSDETVIEKIARPDSSLALDVPQTDSDRRQRGEILNEALAYIQDRIDQAANQGEAYVDLIALEIAKGIQIPNSFPSISNAMRKAMKPQDIVLQQTPSGKSSTEKIRYMIGNRIDNQ